MVALLREHVDTFAWSYQDMPGSDTDIAVHKLPLIEDCPPVKQKPMPEKDEKVRMCVDYRGVNRSSLKEEFPVLHIDALMIWSKQCSSHQRAPSCYKVIPFSLKKAGATYQRSMVALFHDMIYHESECYVDDMTAEGASGRPGQVV
ncbi:hypothetical protein KIW84_073985 [Lathyrus oleraceus]|uniref:Uncharacterized protein n=1 Tax=Pisum sativum TaxID=3888 RepID=A0A9D4ZY16_PEA|nr:hypothetical protein KIW84_073985 [Pisum sativum]